MTDTSDFLKAVSDVTMLQPDTIRREAPEGFTFDQTGEGFDDGLMKSAILCTARSGSSLLSVALDPYGFQFKEYLNPRGLLKKIITDANATTSSRLARPFQDAVAHDNRLSIKMPISGLPYLFAAGEFPRNIGQWKFVYLRRSNLVRQAISSLIARKTGLWTKAMKQTGEIGDEDYSFTEIMNLVAAHSQGNRMIERFIGLMGLEAVSVVYEDFLSDQANHLDTIATHLGLDVSDYPRAATTKPWLERQATDLNDLWEERFRQDLLTCFRAELPA